MKTMFNEFGKPNAEVDEACVEIEKIARRLFQQMDRDAKEGEGYPPVEIRAIGSVMVQAIDCCIAEAVLNAGQRIRETARRNADPNLSAEEILLARAGNKIMAIKHYRQRTIFGLKESKDAVEAWMLENLGTKNPAYVPLPQERGSNEENQDK